MFALLRLLVYLVGFALTFFSIWSALPDAEKAKLTNWLANWTLAAVSGATTILGQGEALLAPIAAAFLNAFNTYGGPIAAELRTPIAGFVKEELDVVTAGLVANGQSTPDNAVGIASNAMADAFGFGVSSAAVTAAFEALFPEKLNVLNGAGPMIAKFAGFDEVAAAVRDPLYENAFGKSLDYHFRSIFKPELPNEADAVTWHSRRLLTDAQLQTIFNYSGLKPEYEAAFVASAYRAIQPRALATLLVDSPFPTAQVQSALEFAGLRPADAAFMLTALEYNSTRNVRTEYLSAAVRSTELGTMTPQELTGVLNDLNYSQDAQAWVQLTVATRKLEQLTELYRRSVSEAYRYGQITDAQYVPSLEAIGINAADAQAHYAVDSIAKTGKAALAALRAEERLAAQRTRAEVKAAIAGYRTGTLDAVALEAALLAAGLDPVIAGFTLTLETLKAEGNEVFVYGLTLSRTKALLLREQVGALAIQVKAQLVAPADALTALAGYGVPQANAQALVADWAATHTTAADVGVLLPR